jgi:hypothetical protein
LPFAAKETPGALRPNEKITNCINKLKFFLPGFQTKKHPFFRLPKPPP